MGEYATADADGAPPSYEAAVDRAPPVLPGLSGLVTAVVHFPDGEGMDP